MSLCFFVARKKAGWKLKGHFDQRVSDYLCETEEELALEKIRASQFFSVLDDSEDEYYDK